MLGTLSVRRAASAPAFTQNDAQLLRLFANQAAIAIENARLFALALEKSRMDRELQVALRVQRSLMPETNPKIPGYQVAGLWRPAREVSGDFYDFIPLEDGKWGIVIADVCDKGMPAALFMATTRSVLRASLRNALNIATAIERANQITDLCINNRKLVCCGVCDLLDLHGSWKNDDVMRFACSKQARVLPL